METKEVATLREIEIKRLNNELRQVYMQIEENNLIERTLRDDIERLQRELQAKLSKEFSYRDERIAQLVQQNDGLLKENTRISAELRQREDRINELNIKITEMAHPKEEPVKE